MSRLLQLAGEVVDSKPRIDLSGEHADVLAQCARILQERGDYFQRGPHLVEPVLARELPVGIRRDAEAVVIRVAEPVGVLNDLQKFATFTKEDTRRNIIKSNPPARLGAEVLIEAERNKENYRILDMVTPTPVMLSDFSVMAEPGYRDGVLLVPQKKYRYEPMPDLPDDYQELFGLAALMMSEMWWILQHFPFAEPDLPDEGAAFTSPSYSVLLSGFLSLIARPALANVPMHLFDAPTAGTGKSKCVDLLVLAATGVKPATIGYRDGRDADDELSKALLPLLSSGDRAVTVDNVAQPLKGSNLNMVLTQSLCRFRVLGKSDVEPVVNKSVMFATGNNLVVVGDLTRRCLRCTLDAQTEFPQARRFDFDPVQSAMEQHPELVMAGLIALSCYVKAGFPKAGTEAEKPPALGSFEDWDKLVRGCIRWLGYADPVRTQLAITEADPQREADGELLRLWFEATGGAPLTLIELAKKADSNQSWVNLMAELKGGAMGDWDTRRIGLRLAQLKDRIIGGLVLRQGDKTMTGRQWSVRKT